jgi:small-conductance mechanosensitive channel
MIFRITIYTLIDYLTIIAYFLNHRLRTVKIDMEYLSKRIKPLLILVTVGFLVVSYLFNMNVYAIVKRTVLEFLVSNRQIGSTEYTLLSILLFFFSVWIAFMVASTIRYLFEPQYQETVRKRSHFGGYLLGIRLLIICTGIIAGVLVSGLPLTNFTIFLGALGVGIGLGLQNIVSNLVSGLIIAFERPFVVGDLLDFGTDTGTVKEISLRATMVTSSEGADILIPNNSLLSQNLKNWTISGKQRFIQVRVNTLQDCNPDDVIRILVECLDRQPGIIRDRCVVYFSDITEKGFEFLVKVLITDLSKAQAIKTDLLLSIQKKSAEAGIRFFEMQRTES